jgi:hypothetical protein
MDTPFQRMHDENMKFIGDNLTKEDAIQSIQEQLDTHIDLLQNELGVYKSEVEIVIVEHTRKRIKQNASE